MLTSLTVKCEVVVLKVIRVTRVIRVISLRI